MPVLAICALALLAGCDGVEQPRAPAKEQGAQQNVDAQQAEAARVTDEARKARLRQTAPAGVVEAEKLSAEALRLREDGDLREALSKMLAARGVASVFAEVSDDAAAFLAKTEKRTQEMGDVVAVMDGTALARGRLQRARELTAAEKYIDADDVLGRAIEELPRVEAGSELYDEVEKVRGQLSKLQRMLAPKVAKARKEQGAEAAVAKPKASASERADAVDAANDLGVGPSGADLIATVAARYGVSPRAVADKAAKSAELCMGGMDNVGADPQGAVAKVRGALTFAEGVSKSARERESVPLDDAFVLYVTSGCGS